MGFLGPQFTSCADEGATGAATHASTARIVRMIGKKSPRGSAATIFDQPGDFLTSACRGRLVLPGPGAILEPFQAGDRRWTSASMRRHARRSQGRWSKSLPTPTPSTPRRTPITGTWKGRALD